MTATPNHFPFERMALERLKFQAQEQIPRQLLDHAAFSADWLCDEIGERMLVKLKAEVLGQRIDPQFATSVHSVVFEWPDGWWQHWKLDHAKSLLFSWVARHWPPRMVNVHATVHCRTEIERFRTFPLANFEWPKNLDSVQVNVLRQGRTETQVTWPGVTKMEPPMVTYHGIHNRAQREE